MLWLDYIAQFAGTVKCLRPWCHWLIMRFGWYSKLMSETWRLHKDYSQSLDVKDQKVFMTLISAVSFKETMKKFPGHIKPRQSVVLQRFQFRQRTKQWGETFITFCFRTARSGISPCFWLLAGWADPGSANRQSSRLVNSGEALDVTCHLDSVPGSGAGIADGEGVAENSPRVYFCTDKGVGELEWRQ